MSGRCGQKSRFAPFICAESALCVPNGCNFFKDWYVNWVHACGFFSKEMALIARRYVFFQPSGLLVWFVSGWWAATLSLVVWRFGALLKAVRSSPFCSGRGSGLVGLMWMPSIRGSLFSVPHRVSSILVSRCVARCFWPIVCFGRDLSCVLATKMRNHLFHVSPGMWLTDRSIL